MANYYFTRDGQKQGPFSADQVKQLATEGQLRPDDLLWKEGWDAWQTAAHVKGLFTKPVTPAARDALAFLRESPALNSPPGSGQQTPPTPAHSRAPPPLPPTATGGLASPHARIGFVGYVGQHFAATRCASAYGICLGLITIPVLSLMKPVIGFRGLACIWVVLFGVVFLTAVGYVVGRFHAYFIARNRAVAANARSWAAAVCYLTLVVAVTLSPAIALELFTPPCGLLAFVIPSFQLEQGRWFGLEERAEQAIAQESFGRPRAEGLSGPTAKGEEIKRSQTATSSNSTREATPKLHRHSSAVVASMTEPGSDLSRSSPRGNAAAVPTTKAPRPDTSQRAQQSEFAIRDEPTELVKKPVVPKPFPMTTQLHMDCWSPALNEEWVKLLAPIAQAQSIDEVVRLAKTLVGSTVTYAASIRGTIDASREQGGPQYELWLDKRMAGWVPVMITTDEGRMHYPGDLGSYSDTIPMNSLPVPKGSQPHRVSITGKITQVGFGDSLGILVRPTSVGVYNDDLYQPPADILDPNSLVDTLVAITQMSYEIWRTSQSHNALRVEPLKDMANEKLASIDGREVDWMARVQRVEERRVLLNEGTLDRYTVFKPPPYYHSGDCPCPSVSFGGPIPSQPGIPLAVVGRELAQQLAVGDAVRVTGQIIMNKRPTISSAHIHVNVEKLRKIEGYELIRFQLVGESKVRLPQ